jgi:DMSO/TMAO reductase YedYZ molybdopterin-dependent catalytic subunit
MKKIVKLAVLRNNDVKPCPYGLSVSSACKTVGSAINSMTPGNTEVNNFIYRWFAEGDDCPFNSQVVDNNVNCTYDEMTHEKPVSGLNISELYPKHFSTNTVDGLVSFPLNIYYDNSIDSGRFYTRFSVAEDKNKSKK